MLAGPRNFNKAAKLIEFISSLAGRVRVDPASSYLEWMANRVPRGFVRYLADIGEGIVGLAYPPRCLGCGDRLFEARTLLCLTCFHGIDRPSPKEADERLQRLPQARSALDSVSCLWVFDKGGALQAVHQALKYGNRPSYGVTLGEPLAAVYHDSCEGASGVDIIIPIPLHRSRLLERGYNQSEMLANGAALILGAPVHARLLVRDRPTKTQTALTRANRWDNLDGAFRVVDPAVVEGRHVLLVDDVLTTGSTAGAAAKALKTAGAARVDLATMALART